MTKSEDAIRGWRDWSYAEWNSKLVDYYFVARDGESASPVEQIPATPHELALIAGEREASAEDIVNRFVRVLLYRLPPGQTSFCSFCSRRTEWTTRSKDPPPFFGMLWLTCLVSYGYPHGHSGSFHERMYEIFGRHQPVECLPETWRKMQEWTVNRAADGTSAKRFKPLVLPPPDTFRSVIGPSWFLAFPHDVDRARLRNLLEQHDLVGEEPPLHRVVAVLKNARQSFSTAFMADFDSFVRRFMKTDGDVRDSAFWRAVRQEAIRSRGGGGSGVLDAKLLASYNEDDELLILYVACKENVSLSSPFSKTPLGFDYEGLDSVVELHGVGSSDAVEQAVEAALVGNLPVPQAARHYRRGVMMFRSFMSGEYELVGGTDAEDADMALVRDDLVTEFVNHFGGRSEPAHLEGWSQVVDCSVKIGSDVPEGLEGITHLQKTMAAPAVRIVGGIRGDDGYVPIKGFLPRVRFHGAASVEVRELDGRLIGVATAVPGVADEWSLPEDLLAGRSGRFVLVVRHSLQEGEGSASTSEIVFGDRQLTYGYKGIGAGTYAHESLQSDTEEIVQGVRMPVLAGREAIEDGRDAALVPDLVEALADTFYLAPRLGDLSWTRTPEHEWLVSGDTRRPGLLLFVGDPTSPLPREFRKNARAQDRTVWRNAVHHSRRIAVRTSDGRIEPMEKHPPVRAVLASFRDRKDDDVPDTTLGSLENGRPTLWQGVEASPAVWELVDAFAALSVRRSGIPLSTTSDLFSRTTGFDRFENAHTLYELLRAWVEAGLLDVLHARSQPVTYVVARRPEFAVHRVGNGFRAVLLGMLPRFASGALRKRAERSGATVTVTRGANPWQPPVMRLEVERLDTLRDLSREFELEPMRRLDTDMGISGGPPDHEEPEEVRVGRAYVREKIWDWRSSRFRPGYEMPTGITVELRRHPQCCPIYVVSEDGRDIYWSEVRNNALIQGYLRKHEDLPFSDVPNDPVVRTWAEGIYLPVRFGRLCAVLGTGLSGPTFDADGNVASYVYPLYGPYRAILSEYLRNPA